MSKIFTSRGYSLLLLGTFKLGDSFSHTLSGVATLKGVLFAARLKGSVSGSGVPDANSLVSFDCRSGLPQSYKLSATLDQNGASKRIAQSVPFTALKLLASNEEFCKGVYGQQLNFDQYSCVWQTGNLSLRGDDRVVFSATYENSAEIAQTLYSLLGDKVEIVAYAIVGTNKDAVQGIVPVLQFDHISGNGQIEGLKTVRNLSYVFSHLIGQGKDSSGNFFVLPIDSTATPNPYNVVTSREVRVTIGQHRYEWTPAELFFYNRSFLKSGDTQDYMSPYFAFSASHMSSTSAKTPDFGVCIFARDLVGDENSFALNLSGFGSSDFSALAGHSGVLSVGIDPSFSTITRDAEQFAQKVSRETDKGTDTKAVLALTS